MAGEDCQKANVHTRSSDLLAWAKALGRVFPPAGGKINWNGVFSEDMRIGKNTSQPASVESGRPLTRLCMQRAVTLRKNAGIFENRVELVRHDKRSWNPSDSRSVAVGVVLWGSPGLPQGLGVGAVWV